MRLRTTAMACAGLSATLAAMAVLSTAQAQGVVGEWNQVKVPPPPTLHEITVDPSKTVLLLMDFGAAGCAQEPRCVARCPAYQVIARPGSLAQCAGWIYHGLSGGKIVSDIASQQGETVVLGHSPDKFYNSNLDDIAQEAMGSPV